MVINVFGLYHSPNKELHEGFSEVSVNVKEKRDSLSIYIYIYIIEALETPLDLVQHINVILYQTTPNTDSGIVQPSLIRTKALDSNETTTCHQSSHLINMNSENTKMAMKAKTTKS